LPASRTLLLALLLSLLAAAVPGAVRAQAPETVIQDDALFLHSDEDGIRAGLQQARELGIERVRLTAGWSVIAPQPSLPSVPEGDLSDPAAYPAGNWHNLDRAVRLTVEAGLRPMIDIAFWAPRWATHAPEEQTERLRTDIDPAQYARFAAAVAARYRGGYVPPPTGGAMTAVPSPDGNLLDRVLGLLRPAPVVQRWLPSPTEPLPAVDIFTIWNEPNHPGFLMPQWRRRNGRFVPDSPGAYRAMVRAAYPAIKSAAPQSTVLIGGTASGGSSTAGSSGVPPLMFLRELACVDRRLRVKTSAGCAGFTTIPGDGWAHHPYSLRTRPDALPRDPDKLPVAATGRLLRTLRTLVAAGRLSPRVADLYQTEYGYETNPPDPQAPFSPAQQPAMLAWAEYLGTRDPGVKMWPQFQLRDRPGDPAGPRMRPYGDWQTGLIDAAGVPKPAFALFRTPGFARCHTARGRRVVAVWGRLRGPERGTPAVDVRARPRAVGAAATGWSTVTSAVTALLGVARERTGRPAPAGAAITRFVAWTPGAQVRLRWTVAGVHHSTTALTPVGCRARAGVRRRGR
jgi:hypothetical protein